MPTTISVLVPKSLHEKEFFKTPFVLKKYMENKNNNQIGGGGLKVLIFLKKSFVGKVCLELGRILKEEKRKNLM